jgi:hypothetical protein
MVEFDELKIYRGSDIQITPKIIVTQPTLDQIEKFGERRYFSAVHTLVSVGADMKWQLWDMGKDYTKINDYDLFTTLLWQMVASKKTVYKELTEHPEKYQNELSSISEEDLQEMLINPLELVLKDVDLANFSLCKLKDSEERILYDSNNDITIDRCIYSQIVDVIRKIHGFKRNNQKPANERTKMDLIEDARDEAFAAMQRPYKSVLKPLVSSLTVKCNQCGDDRIWNMKINMFFDNIKRVNKIQDAELLLQGAYSGFASLKGIDKSRLDWTGDI